MNKLRAIKVISTLAGIVVFILMEIVYYNAWSLGEGNPHPFIGFIIASFFSYVIGWVISWVVKTIGKFIVVTKDNA